MDSSRRLRVILIFLIVLCGVFAYSYSSRLEERNQLEASIAEEQQKISAALDRQAALKADLAIVNSMEFLDRAARQDLDMALPGDEVLVLIRPTPVVPVTMQGVVEAETSRTASNAQIPVWQQWVVFFTE